MASKNKTTPTNVSKASHDVDDISRFRLGEIGNTGLKTFNGITQKELKGELNHPQSVKTYELMSYHPAVNAPRGMYNSMVAKARHRLRPPANATKQEEKRTEIIGQMLGDMEHSIEDTIQEVMSFTKHGWASLEKVFRKRTYASGSLYNDGLIGIRKLPLREQGSIKNFIYDETGNNVIGMVQDLSGINDPYNRYTLRSESEIKIPRSKFMLFTLGSNRSDPYGTSPLRNVYLPWKYLQALEELEAQSVVKDVNGLPKLTMPPQYMSDDATPAQKELYAYFKNMIRNLQQGAQSGVIIPAFYDPETRQPLFDLELLTQDGKKNFDLNKIKDYYRTMIFIGMGADILLMGNTASGSFALGSIKNSLAGNYAESYLKRIAQVFNDDLIPQLYKLNNWDPARRCTFDFEDIEDKDLESLSKAYQRLGATGYLPKTLDVVNRGLDALGIDTLPEDTTQEELDKLLPEKSTKSGQGMEEGLPSGTGEATGEAGNASDTNADNKA